MQPVVDSRASLNRSVPALVKGLPRFRVFLGAGLEHREGKGARARRAGNGAPPDIDKGDQGLASTSATLPSKSVVRTWVELSGTTVFITPVPSLCSHLMAPVLASRAKSKSFLVP